MMLISNQAKSHEEGPVKWMTFEEAVAKSKTVIVKDVQMESVEAGGDPDNKNKNVFYERDGYLSMEAVDFTKEKSIQA